jgi:hypothetical protein
VCEAVEKIRLAEDKIKSKGGILKNDYVVYLFICDLITMLSVAHTV